MFNGNHASNFLLVKEFSLRSDREIHKIIGLNAKTLLLCGRRYIPVDLKASNTQGEVVYQEEAAFSKRGDDVFFINLGVTYRIERKKTSQELKLDIQNLTNHAAPKHLIIEGQVRK